MATKKFYLHCLFDFRLQDTPRPIFCVGNSTLSTYEEGRGNVAVIRSFSSPQLYPDNHDLLFACLDLYKDEASDLVTTTFFSKEILEAIPVLLPDLKKIVLSYLRPRQCSIKKLLQYTFGRHAGKGDEHKKNLAPNFKLAVETKTGQIILDTNVRCAPFFSPSRSNLSCLFFISDSPIDSVKEEKKVVEIKLPDLGKNLVKLSVIERVNLLANKVARVVYNQNTDLWRLDYRHMRTVRPELRLVKIVIYRPIVKRKKHEPYWSKLNAGASAELFGMILRVMKEDHLDVEVIDVET